MSIAANSRASDKRVSKRGLILSINGKFRSSRLTGVERYAQNVLEQFVPLALERGHKVILIGPDEQDDSVSTFARHPHFRMVKCAVPQSSTGRHLWEQLVLPAIAALNRSDYLLNLANTCPVLFANNVLTLHDVSWLQEPKWFSRSFRAAYAMLVPLAVGRAKRIITVSQWSAAEISQRLGVKDKLSVLTEGVGEEFTRVSPAAVQEVLNKLSIGNEYILHVGTIQPRKNLQRLIAAYKRVHAEMKNPPQLVLAGGRSPHFADDQIEAAISSCSSIKYLGYVDDKLLPALYSGALFYASASVYEGFGLTLLEAMACGCPVAASDIMPHRELAGDNAVLFDPVEVDDIHRALLRLATDLELRNQLQQRGYNHVKNFRWDNHASELLNTIESIAVRT